MKKTKNKYPQKPIDDDQEDEIILRHFMSDYAEKQGNRLLAEFENAERDGEIGDAFQAQQAKMDAIFQNMLKESGKQYKIKTFRQALNRVAVFLLAFVVTASVTVFSVDALRRPFVNFIMETFEKYTTITVGEGDDVVTAGTTISASPNAVTSSIVIEYEHPLEGLLPEGYELVNYNYFGESNTFLSYYLNSNSKSAGLHTYVAETILNVDTEGAKKVEHFTLLDYEAILVEKDAIHIVWFDSGVGIMYDFFMQEMDENAIIELAEAVATRYSVVNVG